MPLMSIVVPAKGRPLYTREAVFSAIRQDFDDFDVTLSNNGADPRVKVAVDEFMGDPRFHYIEQPNLLAMPSHWDVASRTVTGDFLLILTNRSVLKRGALQKLAKFLRSGASDVEIVTWGWDQYDNARGVLVPRPSNTGTTLRLKTSDELLRFARVTDLVHHSYTMPRGENSCVSRALVERIREGDGLAFRAINCDLTFGLSCFLNATEFVHFDEALYISQGLDISNGANSLRGDAQPSMDTLGLATPWDDVPIKATLVSNAYAQDFLATLRRYGRSDICAEWNKSKYYKDCLMEIRLKRKAGLLATVEVDKIQKAVETALRNEDASVRASVAQPIARKMFGKAKTLAKILAARGADPFRSKQHRSVRETAFRTVLEAAGFER